MEEGMKDLDDELTNALRREEPPAGFADRVLSRVPSWDPALAGLVRLKADPTSAELVRLKADPTSVGKRPFIQWAAAAALVAAVAGGFEYVAKQKERAEGEAATARVVLALHIARSKLQLVQTKTNRPHEQPEKNSNQ